MIEQNLSNTNETCYNIRIAKICNLNEALVYFSFKKHYISPVVPIGFARNTCGCIMRAKYNCSHQTFSDVFHVLKF